METYLLHAMGCPGGIRYVSGVVFISLRLWVLCILFLALLLVLIVLVFAQSMECSSTFPSPLYVGVLVAHRLQHRPCIVMEAYLCIPENMIYRPSDCWTWMLLAYDGRPRRNSERVWRGIRVVCNYWYSAVFTVLFLRVAAFSEHIANPMTRNWFLAFG